MSNQGSDKRSRSARLMIGTPLQKTPDDAQKDDGNESKNSDIGGRGRFLQMFQTGLDTPLQDDTHLCAPMLGSIDQPGRSE